jgi:hypothetical protein
MIAQDVPIDITDFLTDLRPQEMAPKTVTSYATDLRTAVRWFTTTPGEACAAALVTPTDLRNYRARLRPVERRAPATGRARELPTEGVTSLLATTIKPIIGG